MGLYETRPRTAGHGWRCDSMRACRLVVDTGLHAMGWIRASVRSTTSRRHTTLESTRACVAEIDRYIADPGQACSYMIGRVEIDALPRAGPPQPWARASISRDFHDVLLGSGSPPLDELGRLVDEWIVAAT